ncbi:MAG TPA: ABC transporter substrate-binding protein [Anaeromyxobacter sp.]|nr:ABC transporter substrate-binding protein [Anaeromyxobacter sp.]
MKRHIGRVLLAVALLAAAPALADVNVCIWGTITGPDALVNGMSYGTHDYFQYLNQTKGGIAGQKVNALLLDGRYKLDEELKIYRRCVDQENAVVINGWSTGSAKALREQVQQDAVPFVSETFSSEVLDPVKYPFVFIAGATYEQQMLIGLRAAKAAGAKKVILMHGDNEYGRAPVTVVRKSGEIEKMGLQLLDTIEFRYDAQDLTAQLARVKAANPDIVYIQSSTPQTLVILRDAAKVGLSPKLFIGNMYNISPTIPEQLGPAAEGFRAIQIYANYGDPIPAMKEIEAFKAKNTLAKQDLYYMKGWFKGKVIAAAIESAIKKNGGKAPADIKAFRKSVRDELENVKGLDVGGITPPVTFANHQGPTQARMSEVKGGKYVALGDWVNAQ